MSNLVVILGAGASKGIGLPLLSEIFTDQPVRDYLHNNARDLLEFLEEIIWLPRSLNQDSSSEGLNIEEVLTLLKQWEDANSSPISLTLNRELQRQLFGCIVEAVYRNKGGTRDGNAYNPFVSWCNKNFDESTWISFNWDVKFEQAFYYEMKDQESRLPRCDRLLLEWEGKHSKHLLLKLHGSVSWFIDENDDVHAYRFGSKFKPSVINEMWEKYLSKKTGYMPVIAEPSFFKYKDIKNRKILKSQFDTALLKLSQTDRVIVCGYSMPDGDTNAKELLLTAVTLNPKAIWEIVDPEDRVINNYARLLGKDRVVSKKGYFEDYVDALR